MKSKLKSVIAASLAGALAASSVNASVLMNKKSLDDKVRSAIGLQSMGSPSYLDGSSGAYVLHPTVRNAQVGQVIDIPISITAPSPSSVNMSFKLPTGYVFLGTAPGPAATGKTVSSTYERDQGKDQVWVLVAGNNSSALPDGNLFNLRLGVTSQAQSGNLVVDLDKIYASDSFGFEIAPANLELTYPTVQLVSSAPVQAMRSTSLTPADRTHSPQPSNEIFFTPAMKASSDRLVISNPNKTGVIAVVTGYREATGSFAHCYAAVSPGAEYVVADSLKNDTGFAWLAARANSPIHGFKRGSSGVPNYYAPTASDLGDIVVDPKPMPGNEYSILNPTGRGSFLTVSGYDEFGQLRNQGTLWLAPFESAYMTLDQILDSAGVSGLSNLRIRTADNTSGVVVNVRRSGLSDTADNMMLDVPFDRYPISDSYIEPCPGAVAADTSNLSNANATNPPSWLVWRVTQMSQLPPSEENAYASTVRLAWDHDGVNVSGFNVRRGDTNDEFPIYYKFPFSARTAEVPVSLGDNYITVTAYNFDGSGNERQSWYSNRLRVRGMGRMDINRDNRANTIDLQVLSNVLGGRMSCPTNCDVNRDGSVNSLDYSSMVNYLMRKSPAP